MTIWIATNGRKSRGAANLAKQPGFRRARKGGLIKPHDIVVNWGSSQPLRLRKQGKRVVNVPERVKRAANKLDTFLDLNGVSAVEWTEDKAVAQSWSDNDCVVIARTKLTGHSGQGIIVIEKKQPVPDAPLYTKYVFKVKEFRVHVSNGTVVDTQQKIRDPNREPVTWKVRSHWNGFIFARNNLEPNADRDALAIAATGALGLEFGAVDIIEDKEGKFYVLEVNTAPGLEGQTVQSYADTFRALR